MLGPGDYRDSAWFNRTRHVDELFVPSSCCLDASQKRRKSSSSKSSSVDEPRVCQLDAILLSEPGHKPPVTALKTRVRAVCYWLTSLQAVGYRPLFSDIVSVAVCACLFAARFDAVSIDSVRATLQSLQCREPYHLPANHYHFSPTITKSQA